MKRFAAYFSLLAVLSLTVLQACSHETVFASSVKAVTVSLADNPLRIAVDVDFSRPSAWHVEYWPADSDGSDKRSTAAQNSAQGTSRSVVKFLYPETFYNIQVVLEDGTRSEVIKAQTGHLPADIPIYKVEKSDGKEPLKGYLMQWEASTPGYVTFCDYDGRIVWFQAYGQAIRTAEFDPETKRIAVLSGFKEGEDNDSFYRLAADIIVSDLEGNILMKRKSADGFMPYSHHEFTFLPGGRFLSLQNVVKNYDLTAFGGDASTPVYGEGFLVLDQNFNVIKEWDSFGELDPLHTSYLDPVRFATDYIHANSVAMDENGDFYMTLNRLTELWKIDGKTGEVIYRVGPHGNVDMQGGTFAGGLHAAVVLSPDRILCYANGSDRGISSAVIFNIDPETRTGRYDLKLELPAEYSSVNRSNVQLISDDVLLFSNTMSAKAVFCTLDGQVKKVISRSGISYRGYWFSEADTY